MADRDFSVGVVAAALAAALAALLLAGAAPSEAAFPGGNGKIVFARADFDARWEDPSRPADIWAMNPDGSGKTNLTRSPHAWESDPAVSADGSKVAFVRGGAAIWVMDADSSDQSQLTHTRGVFPTEDSENVQPAWSPDGEKIAFGGQLDDYCSSQLEIFEMDAGATSYWKRTNVTDDRIAYDDPACPDDAHHDSDPAYSPDGERIAFERGEDRPRVFVMGRDGSGKTNLTEDAALESYDPDWGPACAPCPEVPPPGEGDTTDPTITDTRPASGSTVRDRTPTIGAVVRDETSELAKSDITLRFDGRGRGFSYDPDTERLSRATKKLSFGRHTVEVAATDGAGNTATKKWSFRVVRR